MVRKFALLHMLFIFIAPGIGLAGDWEVNLNAGGTSAIGGVHYKRDLNNGYMKTGVSGIYTDDNDIEYKWAEFKFVVGRENIQPGLTCEVGLKGIFGDAKEDPFSGDVGALAFTGYAGYLFPNQVMPIPLEVFTGVSYAPGVLSFRDTDDFLSYNIGFGLSVMQNASVTFEYAAFDVDMEAGPRPWNLDDGVFRLGLTMRF
jgi:hypothetical protein